MNTYLVQYSNICSPIWPQYKHSVRGWCGAERAHFRRRRGSPTTYFFQNGSAFVAELGERESSSIGTRESVRALLHCPPFFTPCDTWSAFVCRLALRSGMKFAMSSRNLGLYEVEGRNQIFSRLSQCNLQSIRQLQTNRPTTRLTRIMI